MNLTATATAADLGQELAEEGPAVQVAEHCLSSSEAHSIPTRLILFVRVHVHDQCH